MSTSTDWPSLASLLARLPDFNADAVPVAQARKLLADWVAPRVQERSTPVQAAALGRVLARASLRQRGHGRLRPASCRPEPRG